MEKGGRTPVILYADYSPELESDRLRLAGLRRYATARKWRVETLEHRNCSPAALRKALARLRPIGCAVECWCPQTALKPALFGRVPVVYFSPPDGPGWEGARGQYIYNAGGDVWKQVSGKATYTITWRPDKSWIGDDGEGSGRESLVPRLQGPLPTLLERPRRRGSRGFRKAVGNSRNSTDEPNPATIRRARPLPDRQGASRLALRRGQVKVAKMAIDIKWGQ